MPPIMPLCACFSHLSAPSSCYAVALVSRSTVVAARYGPGLSPPYPQFSTSPPLYAILVLMLLLMLLATLLMPFHRPFAYRSKRLRVRPRKKVESSESRVLIRLHTPQRPAEQRQNNDRISGRNCLERGRADEWRRKSGRIGLDICGRTAEETRQKTAESRRKGREERLIAVDRRQNWVNLKASGALTIILSHCAKRSFCFQRLNCLGTLFLLSFRPARNKGPN